MPWTDTIPMSSNAGRVVVRPGGSTLPRRSAAPATVALSGEIAPGWRILQPLYVLVEQDRDGSYVISDDIFLVYGAGETATDARDDYVQSLIEYYHILADAAAPDDPTDQAQLRLLRQYVQPSRP